MLLVAFLLVPAVFGFQSSFNYGCQSGKCSYQLVVPKELAQYIDQNALLQEVTQISSSLSTLNNTITNFGDADTTDFTNKFNANFTTVNSAAQNLSTSVQAVSQNASALVTASALANSTAHLLYDSIACFKNNSEFSYNCFTRPTTVAPSTGAPTTVVPTTGNPGTDNAFTVSQGSQTDGSSAAPVSGGTPATNQPASDSTDAVPSTSAGPASPSDSSPSSTAAPDVSSSPSSITS